MKQPRLRGCPGCFTSEADELETREYNEQKVNEFIAKNPLGRIFLDLTGVRSIPIG